MDAIGYNRVSALAGTPELNLSGAVFPLTFTLVGLLTLFSGRRRQLPAA